MRLTKPQLKALKDKWQNSKVKEHLQSPQLDKTTYIIAYSNYRSFLQFRKSVQGTWGCNGAVTVQWCGMWLCIETDGYCHT